MLGRKSHRNPRTIREYLRLFFTGFAMGTADTIPGVSGGTMAFILGIYEDLLIAIKSFDIAWFSKAFPQLLAYLIDHMVEAPFFYPATDADACRFCDYEGVCRFSLAT